MKNDINGVAVSAAFFLLGISDNLFGAFIATQEGQYAAVSALTRFATLADALCGEIFDIRGDMPGVFDYEVSSPFGHWFATFTVDKGSIPPIEVAARQLRDMALEFACQDIDDPRYVRHIRDQLETVLHLWVNSRIWA